MCLQLSVSSTVFTLYNVTKHTAFIWLLHSPTFNGTSFFNVLGSCVLFFLLFFVYISFGIKASIFSKLSCGIFAHLINRFLFGHETSSVKHSLWLFEHCVTWNESELLISTESYLTWSKPGTKDKPNTMLTRTYELGTGRHHRYRYDWYGHGCTNFRQEKMVDDINKRLVYRGWEHFVHNQQVEFTYNLSMISVS